MKSTKEELLAKAESIHYDLCELEEGTSEYTDKMFELTVELSECMREFIDSKFHKSYYKVPQTENFYGGSEVELDPDIAEVVKALNDRGYITVASCAGHAHELKTNKEVYGYIWIRNFPLGKMPKGLRKDANKKNGGATVRWAAQSENDLYIAWGRLLKWVNSLPVATNAPVGPHPTLAYMLQQDSKQKAG